MNHNEILFDFLKKSFIVIFYFHDNPIEENITIETKDYNDMINQTQEMIKKRREDSY